jgi:hyperosmotically inducible protein
MTRHTAARFAFVSLAALALAACGREAQQDAQGNGATVSQKIDKALDRTQQRLAEAGEKTQQTLAETGDRLQPKLAAAGDRIAEAADKTAANVKEAVRGDDRSGSTGATNGSTAGNGSSDTPSGRRPITTTITTGERTAISGLPEGTRTAVADTAITTAIKAQFLKDPDLSVLKIDVDTNDGVVVLNGVADNAAARDRAAQIAQGVRGVKEVRNHLTAKQG